MNQRLNEVLEAIGDCYRGKIQRGSRHYLEVNVGKTAAALGYGELEEKYATTFAIVPLNAPQRGMKVRIDGRTFVDYAEYASGIAVPGYLARESGNAFVPFVANDSMICNFT